MAQAMHIDTLEASKRLTEAGAKPELAEAIVHVFQNADTSQLATKEDIAELRTEIKDLDVKVDAVNASLTNEIGSVRTEMRNGFASVDQRFTIMENRMTIKLGAMIAGAAGVLFALSRLI